MNQWDEPALRYAAFIQAQLVVIEEQSEVLNDLGDLQAHRKLKADVADYIEYQSKSGEIPSNPLSLISERLKDLSNILSECISLENSILDLGSFTEKIDVPSVSLKLLKKTSASLSNWRNELDEKLNYLKERINSLDWENQNPDTKIYSELWVCADVLKIIMPESEDVLNLRLLIFKSGPKYEKLIKYLNDKGNEINHLIEVHSKHVDTIKEAEIQNAAGNHNSALNNLHSIGLKLNDRKKVNKKKSKTEIEDKKNQFTDIDYENIISKIEEHFSFQEKVRLQDENINEKLTWDKLNRKRLKNKQHKHFTKEAESLLSSENKRCDKFNNYLSKYPNSEIENNCKPLLLNISKQINDKENELSRLIGRGRMYRRVKLCVQFVFVLTVFLGGIYYYVKQNTLVQIELNLLPEPSKQPALGNDFDTYLTVACSMNGTPLKLDSFKRNTISNLKYGKNVFEVVDKRFREIDPIVFKPQYGRVFNLDSIDLVVKHGFFEVVSDFPNTTFVIKINNNTPFAESAPYKSKILQEGSLVKVTPVRYGLKSDIFKIKDGKTNNISIHIPHGTIALKTIPQGIDVEIGKYENRLSANDLEIHHGKTPLKMKLRPGHYDVKFSLNDINILKTDVDHNFYVQIIDGKTESINKEFRFTDININSDPEGAQVLKRNSEALKEYSVIGVTPYTEKNVLLPEVGKLSGYKLRHGDLDEIYLDDISVENNKTHRFKRGDLKINTDPIDCIVIDIKTGKEIGKTPIFLKNKKPGDYEYKILSKQFGSQDLRGNLEDNKLLNLTYRFPRGTVSVLNSNRQRIYLDGDFVGVAPLKLEVAIGEHVLSIGDDLQLIKVTDLGVVINEGKPKSLIGKVLIWGDYKRNKININDAIDIKISKGGKQDYGVVLTKNGEVKMIQLESNYHNDVRSVFNLPSKLQKSRIVKVSPGASQCIALTDKGKLIHWGHRNFDHTFFQPAFDAKYQNIDTYEDIILAKRLDGHIDCWGSYSFKQQIESLNNEKRKILLIDAGMRTLNFTDYQSKLYSLSYYNRFGHESIIKSYNSKSQGFIKKIVGSDKHLYLLYKSGKLVCISDRGHESTDSLPNNLGKVVDFDASNLLRISLGANNEINVWSLSTYTTRLRDQLTDKANAVRSMRYITKAKRIPNIKGNILKVVAGEKGCMALVQSID